MIGLAVLAVTAAGCGGGDEPEALPKAAYAKQANRICADFNRDVAKVAEDTFAGLKSRKDLTADKAREFFDAALPKFDAAIEDLDGLGPPKGDEDTVQAIIDAGKSDSEKVEDAKDDDKAIVALVLGDSVTPKFDKKAKAYGLKACGTGG
jgi:hypothetical protein